MNTWFEERKDIFVRELVEGYIDCRSLFKNICKEFEESGKIKYLSIDQWIGTDSKKGPLWNLKDVSHTLFRNHNTKPDLVEYIFDWTIGSIFHEVMKLKEDVYQLEAYVPDKDRLKEADNDAALQTIIEEYNIIIGSARKNLDSQMESIRYLFSKSDSLLKSLLPRYSNNGLLLRFLIKNFHKIEDVLCGETLSDIFKTMYGEVWDKAFIVAAKSYLDGGWHNEAKNVLEMGMKYFPNSQEIEDTLIKLQIGGMSQS